MLSTWKNYERVLRLPPPLAGYDAAAGRAVVAAKEQRHLGQENSLRTQTKAPWSEQ